MSEGLGIAKRRLIQNIVENNWGVIPESKKFNFNELLFIIQELNTQEGKLYSEGRGGRAKKLDVFREFVKLLLYRNLANYDSMLLLTSDKGTGKSSAAMMIGREWCKLIGIPFNPKRHIAYSNADVMRKIDTLNKFEPLICVPKNSYIRIKDNNGERKEQIKNLVNRNDFNVLSYNYKQDKFEWKKPRYVKQTGYEVIDTIELDNGIKVQSTSNHLFLLKSGEYKKMCDLVEGDELIIHSQICPICKTEFYNTQSDAVVCSVKCRKKFYKPYRITYPEKCKVAHRKYYKKKMKNDILYRLKHNLLTRLTPHVKGIIKTKKNENRTEKLIGCNIKQLKEHLEKQFKDGMSWNNYGGKSADRWSIDHIIPLCKFNLKDKKQLKKCFHYTNIQPLWNNLNCGKGRWYNENR